MRMHTLLLALALSAPALPALGSEDLSPEDRASVARGNADLAEMRGDGGASLQAQIDALRIEIAALRAARVQAPAATASTQPPPRVSPRYVNAAKALLGYRMAAFGAPILGYPGYGGSGTPTSIASSALPDPYVPTDGTWNVTGAITSTARITSTADFAAPKIATDIVEAYAGGGTTLRLRNGAAVLVESASGVGGIFGSIGVAKTIADNGNGGTAATDTALPTGFVQVVTCSDAQGCEWTPTETSARDGGVFHVVNVGTNTLTVKHAAGQVLLNGGNDEALGQYDALTLFYSSSASAYIQIGATSNN